MMMLPPDIKASTMDHMPITFCESATLHPPIWDSKRYSSDIESQMTLNDPSSLLDPHVFLKLLYNSNVYIIKWRNKLS